MPSADRVISAEQAAKLIYSTASPSSSQVEKIKEKIERGALRRSQRGGLTTTTDAVAEYMARHTEAAGKINNRKRAIEVHGHPDSYRDVLKDYFLAVLLQRTERRRSSLFKGTVLAMQIALVLLPLVVFYVSYQDSLAALIKSPERAAVETWLSTEFDAFEIESFQPTMQGEDEVIRVEFWYSQQGSKRIQSLRLFTVEGDQVTNVTMPE